MRLILALLLQGASYNPPPDSIAWPSGCNTLFLRCDRTFVAVSGGGSGTPGSSVVPELTFGLNQVVGIATEYARQDHSHGTPTITEPDIPTNIARDTEISSSIATHSGLTDPHTGYRLESVVVPDADIASTIARDSEVSSAISTHEGLANPHSIYATDTDLSTHVAAADPHTGYRLESVSLVDADISNTLTASQLNADGTDCPAGQYARGIDTVGNATGCTVDATGGGGTSNTAYARLSANSALSTITKTNLSGLSFVLAASTNYSYECKFYTTANAATVGVQFTVTFGGTVTATIGMFQGPGAATTLLWISDTSFPLDFNPLNSQGNVAGMVTLSGTVEVSGTGGTLQFQHASETATLTTVQRGSWCQLATH